MEYWETFDRLRRIRDEFLSARFSVKRAIRQVDADTSLLTESEEPLKPSQLRQCGGNLELTYLLRLFTGFEAIIRRYWEVVRPRPTPRRTNVQILMNRIAIECQIPFDILQNAHEVREYRNEIAHRDKPIGQITFDQCKSRLGVFLAYLPRRW